MNDKDKLIFENRQTYLLYKSILATNIEMSFTNNKKIITQTDMNNILRQLYETYHILMIPFYDYPKWL